MNNDGVWLSDPRKEIKIEEINSTIYFCKEQIYADAFVKGKITKKEYETF